MFSKNVPVSQLLNELVENTKDRKSVTFGEISSHLRERGFAVLMILFTIPVAIPIPGLSTVLGTPLIMLAIQMVLGKDEPVLPNWVAKKSIKTSHLSYAIGKATKYFVKMEKFLKPRVPYFNSELGEKIVGVIALICAITVALPIWGGNALPSAGIFIMSFGLLGKDGVVVIAGIVVSIIGIFVAYFIVFLFFYGAQMAADGFLYDIYKSIINSIGVNNSILED